MAAEALEWPTVDYMEGRAVRCELVIGPDGGVAVIRGFGCTHADVMELCRLVVEGDRVVNERADGEAGGD